MRTRHAFSLIELLVVIGIIAGVLAILMPMLGHAREAAQRSVCASNLRQIGLAYHSYANDNKGSLPAPAANGNYPYFIHYADSGPATAGGAAGQPKFDAGRFLFPYVRSMNRTFLCPSASEDFYSNHHWTHWPQTDDDLSSHDMVTMYCQLWGTGGNWPFYIRVPHKMSDPGNCLLAMDITQFAGRIAGAPTLTPFHEFLHSRGGKLAGANALLLDGSVHWYARSELTVEADTNVSVYLLPNHSIAIR